MKPETLAIHTGHAIDPATGAVTPPIVLSTTFQRAGDGSFPQGFVYTRSNNPNRHALESALAALEAGESAAAFASGQAATASILHALAPGDHVILPQDIYFGTRALLETHYARWGLEHSSVDMTDLREVEAAIRPRTKLIWVETPSNPCLFICDIRRLAALAHQVGGRCLVDNTWATPILQHPLALGADLVMHATTKYIGGHSDVLGGCVVAKRNDEFFERVRSFQALGGGVPSPFDCWLLLRSIPTLHARMRVHCANAQRVAEFLNQHPKVERVHYPGLPGHTGHELAAEQMEQFGGMLSFEVKGGAEAARLVAARVALFTRATSLGGYESLIEHRASIEGTQTRAPQALLRLSIGLEHSDDLIDDLAQALLN
jgi:cystathionine gamma-synthase